MKSHTKEIIDKMKNDSTELLKFTLNYEGYKENHPQIDYFMIVSSAKKELLKRKVKDF